MNYITDRNSFALTQPPAWWLVKMSAFDPKLVLIPSRFKRRHLLCRRVGQFSRGLAPLTVAGETLDSDTAMCIEHGLIPVTWVSCENWSQGALDYMLVELKARDNWPIEGRPLDESDLKRASFEGETKVSRLLDDRDAANEKKIDRQNRERVYHATGDAWRYRQHLKGERVLNAGSAESSAGMPKGTVDTLSAT